MTNMKLLEQFRSFYIQNYPDDMETQISYFAVFGGLDWDIDTTKPISELIDNFKKQFEDAFEVQIDQKHYLYAKEQSSPEAFYMMICEVLLLDDLAHDNKIIFIDVPENIFQKDLVAYTKGKEAKDFHFFMNFLGYLVNLSCKNLSIFVSLQSLYAVEFIKSSPASQHRIQSIVLL